MLRLLNLGLVSIALGGGLVGACGFPEVSFRSEDAEGGPEAGAGIAPPPSAPASAAETGTDPPANLPPDVDPGGKDDDAATREDGGTRVEAGPDGACQGAGGNGCDCDGDYAKNASCATGALDCDDFDGLVRPGQGFVASPWDSTSPHAPAGDWNCDGTVTKQYAYGVTCGLLANCTEGFASNPGCGQSATYNVCEQIINVLGLPIGCHVKSSDARPQGCR